MKLEQITDLKMKTIKEANLPLTNNEAIQNMLKGNIIEDKIIRVTYIISILLSNLLFFTEIASIIYSNVILSINNYLLLVIFIYCKDFK